MELFGTSGIRRVADAGLIQLAFKVGLAVGNIYRNTVVSCDSRTSSEAMKHAVISGLLASGAACSDAGLAPTPTLALTAKDFAAGVMTTASHNPPQYNGIKLVNPDGSSFDQKQQKQIEERILGGPLGTASWQEMKNASNYRDAVERHIQRILTDFPNPLKLKVALDCGCGAGAVITPYLLKRMGCEVIGLNCYPSGFFPHDIEPVEANLGDLMKITRELGADLGIAQDGDADRMMVVDDKGRFIPGDKLMVILAQAAAAREVVTTIDTTMAIEDMGYRVTRTRVGDTCVSEELRKSGDFGAEPSGSWIFPGISLCPDGIYAAARIVSIASQQRLSQLVDMIPSYPLLRGSSSSQGVMMNELERRLMALQPVSVNDIDGLRLSFEDGWLLVRPSGTEPKIRVTAEAKSEARARELYNSGIAAIQECVETGRVL
jgi:phosphoglucosamine mutase